jgi:hypothetical protein
MECGCCALWKLGGVAGSVTIPALERGRGSSINKGGQQISQSD